MNVKKSIGVSYVYIVKEVDIISAPYYSSISNGIIGSFVLKEGVYFESFPFILSSGKFIGEEKDNGVFNSFISCRLAGDNPADFSRLNKLKNKKTCIVYLDRNGFVKFFRKATIKHLLTTGQLGAGFNGYSFSIESTSINRACFLKKDAGFDFEIIVNSLFEAILSNLTNTIPALFLTKWVLNDTIISHGFVCPSNLIVEQNDIFYFELEYLGRRFKKQFDTSIRFVISEFLHSDTGLTSIQNLDRLDFIRINNSIETNNNFNNVSVSVGEKTRFVSDLTTLSVYSSLLYLTDDELSLFINLEVLTVFNTSSAFSDISFKKLTSLVWLHIYDTPSRITDVSLKLLTNLVNLRISNTTSLVTDVSVSLLLSLNSIRLDNTLSNITDVSVSLLTNLIYIHIGSSPSLLTDVSVSLLINLRTLIVFDTLSSITDDSFSLLIRLTYIHIGNTPSIITNTSLINLTSLQYLLVSDTDSIFDDLSENISLIYLSINNCDHTTAQIDSIIQWLDVHNLSNGYFSFSGTVGRTFVSDVSTNSLLSKGWIFNQ